MPLDINRLQRQREAMLAAGPLPRPHRGRGALGGSYEPEREPEELSLVQQAGDILAAPFRGIEGAAQDLYGLADAVAFDILPDWEERFFGESRTAVGGVVEGISNFAAGFVPVFGWLGKAGKVGRAFNVTKKAQRAARIAGKGRRAAGLEVARGAVAGAITDFAVFDGHEQRISNLLQRFPQLETNAVVDFLAADDADSELLGRAKNSLEGLGLGAVTDALFLGIRALHAGRKARAGGAGPEEVQEAMDAAVPPDEIQNALGRAAQLSEEAPPRGTEPAPARRGQEAAGERLEGETPDGTGPAPEPATEPLRPAEAPPSVERTRAVLGAFDLDEERVEAVLSKALQRSAQGLDPRTKAAALTPEQRLAEGLLETDLNLSRFRGPDGALQLMRAMEAALEGVRGKSGPSARRSLNEQESAGLRELASLAQENNPQRLMAMMQRDVDDLRGLNTRILAYKTAFQAYASSTAEMAAKVVVPGADTTTARLEFKLMLDTLADMEMAVKGLLGEQGRGLGANRIPTRALTLGAGGYDRAAADRALRELGGAEYIDSLARRFQVTYQNGLNPAGAIQLARGSKLRRAWNITTEYWINSILSGPATQAVNAISGALTSIYRPLESIVGGALTGQASVIQDAVGEIMQLGQSVPEALHFAWAAGKKGENILDPLHRVSDVPTEGRKAIVAENLGVSSDSPVGRGVNWIGKLVRVPGNLLVGTDELVKQINYRSVARARLAREGAQQGLSGDELSEFVAEQMDFLIWNGQALSNAQLFNRGVEDGVRQGIRSQDLLEQHAMQYARRHQDQAAGLSELANAALDRAEEVTFTRPLREGSLSAKLQDMVIQHPYLRLVMPFVRTPINLASFALQRIDAPGAVRALAARRFPRYAQALQGSHNRLIQDALSGDPRKQADAVGRLAAGMSLTTFMLQKATERTEDGYPLVTGAGPSDLEQRRILEEGGWQPYSFRVGDGYVSYARMDPFATLLGTAADVADYARYADVHDQDAMEQLSFGLATALANNITNKTYLSGVANLVQALSDPTKRVPAMTRTLGASFIPSAAKSLVFATGDEAMRDVHDMADAVRNRLPGLSDNLPPVRNILGEPVTRPHAIGSERFPILDTFLPVAYRDVSSDLIRRELFQLKHGFTPPRRVYHGIDLSEMQTPSGQTVYDRWGELHGKVKLRGLTLRDRLSRLIRSKRYQGLPAESTHDIDSPRIQEISRVLNEYRRAAFDQVLREVPELRAQDRERIMNRRALKRGVERRPSILEQL